MENDNITKFVKKQIKNNDKWTIESINLDGTDAFDYTYSYKKNKLYVMIPDEESVKEAKKMIDNTQSAD